MPPHFRRIWRAFSPDGFVWDRAKSDLNLADRGFDFGFATLIFKGPVIERRDTRHKAETRFQAIGSAEGAILFVVYTIRDHQCRIISARIATPVEAALYHG